VGDIWAHPDIKDANVPNNPTKVNIVVFFI